MELEITPAFPTLIGRFRIPDAEAMNQDLHALVLGEEAKYATLGRSNIGGWHSRPDFLNRLDANAAIFTNENSQLFRMGAQGMPGSANNALSCFSINATEQVWTNATPLACSALPAVPQVVQAALCGLTTRFEASAPAICDATFGPMLGPLD